MKTLSFSTRREFYNNVILDTFLIIKRSLSFLSSLSFSVGLYLLGTGDMTASG